MSSSASAEMNRMIAAGRGGGLIDRMRGVSLPDDRRDAFQEALVVTNVPSGTVTRSARRWRVRSLIASSTRPGPHARRSPISRNQRRRFEAGSPSARPARSARHDEGRPPGACRTRRHRRQRAPLDPITPAKGATTQPRIPGGTPMLDIAYSPDQAPERQHSLRSIPSADQVDHPEIHAALQSYEQARAAE